jgi:hypothetical protein
MLNSQYFNLKESNSADSENYVLFQQHLFHTLWNEGLKQQKMGGGIESKVKATRDPA